MYLIGFDIGSSSVKASLLNIENGQTVGSAFYPKTEMVIDSPKPGFAEQNPETWWENLTFATRELLSNTKINPSEIQSIGISYQMHGLVLVDKHNRPLRNSIIWCDSRAVEIGNQAFQSIGKEKCLNSLLNSPGNFTASKLKWVIENETEIYKNTFKMMLPGDYIALKLTGQIHTTISGLSEGIFWDFQSNTISQTLLNHYEIEEKLIPDVLPTFSIQGYLTENAANETGLKKGTPVTYRAGDQPNNAFSLNVLNPGEIAATAGTSGVVYGVSEQVKYDPESRVNTFAHVNHSSDKNRLGVLLCINGTGILNSWVRRIAGFEGKSYDSLNQLAESIAIGSDGLCIIPFGNGAERVLGNKLTGASIANIDFNRHSSQHILRAAQEGIVFSFQYGIEIMKGIGINPTVIRAGNANMFLSPIFRETLAGISGATIELYNTDGSQGAARGAGIGAGIYKNTNEAFEGLNMIDKIHPNPSKLSFYQDAFFSWKKELNKALTNQ